MENKQMGLLTVAGVVNLPDDSWVEGGFEGTVISINAIPKKAGGEFYKVELGDVGGGGQTLFMSAFVKPSYRTGDKLRVSGQGIKKGSYNGSPQVSIGKTTVVAVAARGGSGMQGTNPPPSANAVPGPTAGMAINNALTLCSQGLDHKALMVAVESPRFWGAVWHVASDIVRVARMLENGKLAVSVAERAGGSSQPPPPPPPAHDPERELDAQEEVPF